MAQKLSEFVGQLVSVVTTDGKHYLGVMRGFDQLANIMLEECVERVWAQDRPYQDIDCQVMLIRGDIICVIGKVEGTSDLTTGPPIPPIYPT